MDKLLSIIVPVYKAEKHLDRCVESILSQTYGDIELVLVDDGSPDAEALTRYGAHPIAAAPTLLRQLPPPQLSIFD